MTTFDLDGEILAACRTFDAEQQEEYEQQKLPRYQRVHAAFHRRLDPLIEPALQEALHAAVWVDTAVVDRGVDERPEHRLPAWLEFTFAGAEFRVREWGPMREWEIYAYRHQTLAFVRGPVKCTPERLRLTLLVQMHGVREECWKEEHST